MDCSDLSGVDIRYKIDQLESDIDHKHERILLLESAIKEIYALCGEDYEVNEICNRVLP